MKIGLKIHYLCEDTPLGTGGAIKNAEEFFNDTFIVVNADILSDIDITDMMKFHKEKNSAVTIALAKVENPADYGVIEYNKDFFVESFSETPEHSAVKSNYINAGIYIFEPNVLTEIPESEVVSMEKETLPLLLKKDYPIAVYKSDAYWMEIETVEKYNQVHQDILDGKCHLAEFKDESQNIFIGENTTIHATAKIIAPVYIGENAKIGAYSTIGPNTVIGNGCRVGISNVIIDSIVWDKMSIQNNSTFSSIVLSSGFMVCKTITNTKATEGEIFGKNIAL
jgi:mannose-1-phosphate guanylyltransferase